MPGQTTIRDPDKGQDAAVPVDRRPADERSLLSTLTDTLPDAVYVKDRESRFVLCNREVLRRKGVASLEEIVGRTDFAFYPPELARNTYDDEQDLMRTGRSLVNKERCVVDKITGEPTWNLTTKVPLRNAENEIIGLVGIGRDITDRKRAEEACQAIVDRSLQGLVIIQNMRIVFANNAMAKISGYTIEEMQTASTEVLREFIHPLDRERVWRQHAARLAGESLPEQQEFRIFRKDGSVRWLEIYTSRVEYQGWPAIQAACIDMTERRRAEEALRRSEARNLALLNANPDLMFRLSRGGVFLDCKPSKDDAVSVSPAQFVGRHLDEVFPESLTRTLMGHIQAAIETGHVQTLEYNLPSANGEGSDFECRLVCCCAEQEVVAIVRDISERRRAERLARLQRDVAIRLSSLSDLKEALQYCLEAAVKASQMDCGGIYTADESTGGFRLDVHLGLSKEFTSLESLYSRQARNSRVILNGEPVYTTHAELGVPIGPVQRTEGLRAVGVIPIADHGRIIACLNVASHTIDEVPPGSRVILEAIAAQIGSAVSRLKIQEALRQAEQEKAIILNTMPQIVAYHDVSDRILWANRTAREALGKTPEEIVGRRCHELWEGTEQPCEGCPVDRALRTGCSQESEIVGYDDGSWLVRGEPVRDAAGAVIGVVEMALDISRRKRDEEELRRRLQFEEMIALISTDFVNLRAEEIEAGIDRTLTGIGRLMLADRSYVYLLHDGGAKMSKLHEWRADGVDQRRGRASNVDVQTLGWALEQLRNAGVLNIPAAALENQAAEARELLESICVKSLLAVPIVIGGQLFGLLGLSTVHRECAWPEDATPFLKIVAEILANALERKRSAEAVNERLAFETLLSNLSATFVHLAVEGIDLEIERSLSRIGEFLGIDRCTIFQFSGAKAIVTHSWAVPGLRRASPGQCDGDLEWDIEQLRKGGILTYAQVEDAPAEAQREKGYCQREGMKSVVAIPLEVGGSMSGAIAFSSVRTRRDWPDELVQRLRLVGQIFANALLRRRAEEALRASEARLRSIIRAAPTGIGLVASRVLLEVNDRICEMLGYRLEELVNCNARILYPTQEEYERVGREKYRQIEECGTGTIETCWKRKDGSLINVLLSSTPLDFTDRSKGIMFTALDITERTRAQRALQESEARFREMAELLPQTVFEADMPGYFTFANRAGLRQFGYAEPEVRSVNMLQMVVPEDRERAAENIQKRLAGKPVSRNEYTALSKDGRTFPVLLHSSPILREGRPAGIRGIVIDITELKRAEAALRESEQNYREIFNATNDALLIHDPVTGAILDVNRTAVDTYGYTYEEMLQLSPGATNSCGPYTRQEALKRIHKTTKAGPQLFEWLSQKKSGDSIWEEVSLRTAMIGGKPRVLAVIRDITDRKKNEAQMQQHLAELTRAWHANTLGEMASGLAHELNQPLCAIVNYSNGCLRLTRRQEYSVETLRNSIEQIAAQAQRAADILKRIRSLIAKREPQWAELDLDSILANAVQMLKGEAVRCDVTIISRLQADLPKIRGDSVEIEQVALNLVRNAIEAMNDAQITHRTLTISRRLSDNRQVEVTVADTGRGVSPELSEKIFESFFTTKPQGLGIGLSLSRRIIEAHGGRLWAEPQDGPGATFKFTLPVEGSTHGQR